MNFYLLYLKLTVNVYIHAFPSFVFFILLRWLILLLYRIFYIKFRLIKFRKILR
jgi:hypothetical protein